MEQEFEELYLLLKKNENQAIEHKCETKAEIRKNRELLKKTNKLLFVIIALLAISIVLQIIK